MTRRAASILLLAMLLVAQHAAAHTRSESYSHWHLDDRRIVATVTVPLREVMLLYETEDASVPASELLLQNLKANTRVFAAGTDCSESNSNVLQAAPGFVRIELQFECTDAAPDSIQYRALFDQAPAHVHYIKLHIGGLLAGEALLTDSADEWNFAGLSSADSWSFSSFVEIGTQHITSGLDHIAFLLGLLLISGSAGRAVIAITGFTLGHSVSLAAAVLGYVSAESQLVEAFIGFTVLLVAGEYFLLRHADIGRFAVAGVLLAWATGIGAYGLGFINGRALLAYVGFGIFAACYLFASKALEINRHKGATSLLLVATCSFGLVHGFGFAGFLMDSGVLGTSLLVPLLGFNLGVELGQLILVGVALIVGALLKNHVPTIMPQLLAAGLCSVGMFWFVGRTLA